jgi:DNA-binding LacI/PurR family transcriptional regulator
MRTLLQRRPRLDAVFVASDTMASGALQVLAGAGRRVPEDVAVVGFNDDPLAETTYPPLSSVRQPVEEMGREMVQLLLELIRTPHGARRRVVLSTQLQVRRSSATPGQEGPGVTEGYRVEAIHTDVDRQLTRAPRDGQALLPR